MKQFLIQAVRYLNPCDIDRAKWLTPVGDGFYLFYRLFTAGMLGKEEAFPYRPCPCCLGMRILTLAAVALLIGALLC